MRQLRQIDEGTPTPGADEELQRTVLQQELDQWTKFHSVGKLVNGDLVQRDWVPRGMSSLVGLLLEEKTPVQMCCHESCSATRRLAICTFCLHSTH